MSTPSSSTVSASTRLALGIARADMQYVGGALMRPGDPTSGWLFAQWGVMTAYEALPHIAKVLKSGAPEPVWDPAAAQAARMAGKFFDDRKRTIEDLASYFQRLRETNREEFFPADRLGPEFDFLRTDLGVLLYDEVPVASNIGGFFFSGVDPDRPFSSEELGPRLLKLGQQIGRTLNQLSSEHNHRGPLAYDEARFTWWDADTTELSQTVFRGMFDTSMTLAMLTLQGAVRSARQLSYSNCCGNCVLAAAKHRYVVTYQALTSLRKLRSSGAVPDADSIIDSVFQDPACARMLSDGYRQLRNGWLHLGLPKVGSDEDTLTLDDVVRHYTGHDPSQVGETADAALGFVSAFLDQWCMTPKDPARPLSSILQVPHE